MVAGTWSLQRNCVGGQDDPAPSPARRQPKSPRDVTACMPTDLAATTFLLSSRKEHLVRLALQRIRHMLKRFGIGFDFANQMGSKMMRKSSGQSFIPH